MTCAGFVGRLGSPMSYMVSSALSVPALEVWSQEGSVCSRGYCLQTLPSDWESRPVLHPARVCARRRQSSGQGLPWWQASKRKCVRQSSGPKATHARRQGLPRSGSEGYHRWQRPRWGSHGRQQECRLVWLAREDDGRFACLESPELPTRWFRAGQAGGHQD